MPLRVLLPLLLTSSVFAQSPVTEVRKNPIGLLPDGSVMTDVLLPRYDENQRLVGDLRATQMTLIDPERIRGRDVQIRFYGEKRTLRGKVKMRRAIVNQVTSILKAREDIKIIHDQLTAEGTGLTYAYQEGKGFINGPATTILKPKDQSTSMKPKTLSSVGALAIALSPVTVQAEKPETPTPVKVEETTRMDVVKTVSETDAILTETLLKTDESVKIAREFSGEKIAEKLPKTPAAEPLAVNPEAGATIINCDGGMYFDTEAGILVYLDNVTVKDPRFNLSGAKELKIIFEQKPKTEGEAKKSAGNFGEVEKIVARGAVRIFQKGVGGKDPVEASGAVLTYSIPKGEIIINGGYPWVKQGSFFARAKQANLTLRLMNDGSFSTRGKWEMGGNLNLKAD